jgi:hypothetical protein
VKGSPVTHDGAGPAEAVASLPAERIAGDGRLHPDDVHPRRSGVQPRCVGGHPHRLGQGTGSFGFLGNWAAEELRGTGYAPGSASHELLGGCRHVLLAPLDDTQFLAVAPVLANKSRSDWNICHLLTYLRSHEYPRIHRRTEVAQLQYNSNFVCVYVMNGAYCNCSDVKQPDGRTSCQAGGACTYVNS